MQEQNLKEARELKGHSCLTSSILLENWEDQFDKLKLYADTLPWKEQDFNEKHRKLFIKKLLAAQALISEAKGREEQRKADLNIIEKYTEFSKTLHKNAHEDNLNMLLYDAHSRIIACQHLQKKILNQNL